MPLTFVKPNIIGTKISRAVQVLVHAVSVFYLIYAYWLALADKIGGDPVESLLHFYGVASLRLLLLALLLSPLVRYLRQPRLMRLRRPLGLYAFAYACAHIAVFAVYELGLDMRLFLSEIVARPFITVGLVAWLVLLVLAVTSIPVLVRKLAQRWQPLHKTVYLAGVLICVHFIWSVKANLTEPLFYIFALAVLLLARWAMVRRYLSFTLFRANIRSKS